MEQEISNIEMYGGAVQAIKDAILQGQYAAAKSVNRIQLAVYFAIGKYISQHTRKNAWGTHALEFISERLRKELPGLRGFGETQLREMRLFYEGWIMLDNNSSVVTDELYKTENVPISNSSVATAELNTAGYIDDKIDVDHAILIPNINFPIEEFFSVPFSHHTRILAGTKDVQARYYYIHRVAEEHLTINKLKTLLKDEAHLHQAAMPNNFSTTLGQLFGYLQILDDKMRKPHENPPIGIVLCQEADHAYCEYAVRDYTRPMGVTTYKTLDDMPEHIRKALPDAEKMMGIINNNKK